MPAKSTSLDTSLLNLILNAIAIANIADNAGSGPLTNLYLALHTADPGVGGSQQTNEATYTNYARTAIARSSGSPAWTVSAGSASNAAVVSAPQCGASGNTLTHFSIGTLVSGAGLVLYKGALSASLILNNLETPQFGIGALVITES